MEDIWTSATIDDNGTLVLHDRPAFAATLACFPGTAGRIVFEPHRNVISHNQRKYFFGVIVDILHAFFVTTGEDNVTKADVYDFLKERFLFREKMCPITHKYIKVPISMSDKDGSMDMKEFSEKKEAIQKWGSTTLGIDIPEPDKNWRMYKKEKENERT